VISKVPGGNSNSIAVTAVCYPLHTLLSIFLLFLAPYPSSCSLQAVYGCNVIYKFEGNNLITAVGYAEELPTDTSLVELAAVTGGYGDYFGATGQVYEFHDATGGFYNATIILPYQGYV
jgi:hypothetical protein